MGDNVNLNIVVGSVRKHLEGHQEESICALGVSVAFRLLGRSAGLFEPMAVQGAVMRWRSK